MLAPLANKGTEISASAAAQSEPSTEMDSALAYVLPAYTSGTWAAMKVAQPT